jgi:DNA-binding transcriptional regulator YbjK
VPAPIGRRAAPPSRLAGTLAYVSVPSLIETPADAEPVPPAKAILNATLQLVGEGGLEAVRHRRVAELAGVSLGAIPRHYPTRAVLLEQALRLAARRDIRRVERFTLDLQTQAFDPDQWAAAIASVMSSDLDQNPVRWLATYELILASARDESLRDLMMTWFGAYQRFAELGFRAAGSATPELHAQLLVATLTGTLLQQLAQPEANFESAVLQPVLHEVITKLVPA